MVTWRERPGEATLASHGMQNTQHPTLKGTEWLVGTDRGAEVGEALWRYLQGPRWEAREDKDGTQSRHLSTQALGNVTLENQQKLANPGKGLDVLDTRSLKGQFVNFVGEQLLMELGLCLHVASMTGTQDAPPNYMSTE